MKKLALLMGSLLIVGATASAKEAVAAPVVVEESKEVVVAPVVIIEEAPAWRPSGFASLGYRYYGEDEYSSASYGRLQLEGAINLTENQKLYFRQRDFQTYQSFGSQFDKEFRNIKDFGDWSETLLQYFYNSGNIGDSKVNLTHRLTYRMRTGNGSPIQAFNDPGAGSDNSPFTAFKGKDSQRLEYGMIFDVTDYVTEYTPEWFKNSYTTLMPRYRYDWTRGGNYMNTLGLDFNLGFKMPWGFSLDFGYYPRWEDRSGSNVLAGKYEEKFDNIWVNEAEFFLKYEYALWQNSNSKIRFRFNGGLDSYVGYSEDVVAESNGDFTNGEASWFAQPELRYDYQATEFVGLWASAGAEYRNWDDVVVSELKNWSWMPQAEVGFKVNF